MSYPTDRKMSLVRVVSGAAALMVTFTIVFSLDSLSDRYSAATLAKAPIHTIVVAQR